ncbi:MAG: Lrp/AsnC family transcriptional regulator [Desulfobacterales bacterium]|nr:Lrp/AsnC family transcriptional regulator [Desulfobacterales bacterium]
MDDVDYRILNILQKKARIPNVEVARQVEMAPSAVLERIRKLEKAGIIEGYEVRLNPEKFRRRQVAFVSVAMARGANARTLGDALAALCEVQEVHFISGGDDGYLVKVRVANAEALGRLITEKIHGMDGVAKTRTAVVLSTLKETAKIPIDAPNPE